MMKAIAACLVPLIDACKRSSGKRLVLEEGREEEFEKIIKEGGAHVIKNSRQDDGTFKNQAVLRLDPGTRCVFEIFTRQQLRVH